MVATTPRTRPAPLPLALSLSHALRWQQRHRHWRRASRELRMPTSSCRASSPSVTESASRSSFFSTSRLLKIEPRWATFLEFVVVKFTAVATPTPTNPTATLSLPSSFLLSHIRAYLGLILALCHTLSPMVVPPSRNTATVPPRSPPATIPHVSRLTGVSRVRPFHLGSSALSRWCSGSLIPMLYQTETSGVSWDSPVVLPWPTTTLLRCSNPRTTYFYRCGRTQGIP